MDSKLRKILDKPVTVFTDAEFGESDILKIRAGIASGSSHLISMIPGPKRTAAITGIISRMTAENLKIWIAVSDRLSVLHALFHLRSALGETGVHTADGKKTDGASPSVTLWPLEMLFSMSPSFSEKPLCDLLIIDDADCLSHPRLGGLSESLLLSFPLSASLILFARPSDNTAEITEFLTAARRRPCVPVLADSAPFPLISACMDAGGELIPLTDRKRLSKKVKQLVKGEKGVENLENPHFVRGLAAQLREENLLPAVIVMPTAAACEAAVRHCPSVADQTGDALTQPVIAAAVDLLPSLKEGPEINRMLHRRAAPFHRNQHIYKRRIIGHLLDFGYLDMLFATPEAAEDICCRFRAVIWCMEPHQPFPEKDPETEWGMKRWISLAGRRGRDSTGLAAVVHTAGADMVSAKDFLQKADGAVQGYFFCTSRSVLGLAVGNSDPFRRIHCSLTARQNPPCGEFSPEELDAELYEQLPNAACSGDLLTVSSLTDMRARAVFRTERLRNPKRRISKAETAERKELETVIASLPCEECPHFALCRDRGSKRIRQILEKYEPFFQSGIRNIEMLRINFRRHQNLLAEFGLMDEEGKQTPDGNLALRTGLEYPEPCIRWIRNRGVPIDDPNLNFAALGGFLPCPAEGIQFTENVSASLAELTPVFDRLTPVLKDTRKRMLKYGLLPDIYSRTGAALLLSYRKAKNMEALTLQTGAPPGPLCRLADRAEFLDDQVRGYR